MIKLYSTQQARELDARASRDFGIPSEELMARAGRSAATFTLQRWPLAQRIVVLCGPGNNGGDGYVVAHLLRAAVRDVAVFSFGVMDAKRSPDADAARIAYLDGGGAILPADALTAAVAVSDLVIDALFGIGTRPITGELALIVRVLNALNKPVLALDAPSGLDGDTGSAGDGDGAVVRAHATLSFIVHKLGLFTGVAPAYVGVATLHTLALPSALFDGVSPVARARLNCPFASTPRDPTAHKGNFGHVWAVGGAPGFAGAVSLCAQAALRSGAGLVSVLTDAQNTPGLLSARPELMVHETRFSVSPSGETCFSVSPSGETCFSVSPPGETCFSVSPSGETRFSVSPPGETLQFPEFKPGTVLAIGPGLGKSDWARALFAQALNWPGPRVLDADALNLLAERDGIALGPLSILTPHPGEAARLLRCDIASIARDRPAAVRALAEKYACVALLKGAGTLIAAANDPGLGVCVFGNAGMASGGMGDVLTGVIAALLAQGLCAFDAAEQGAVLHAQAADRAAKAGMRGMLASDVIAELRAGLNCGDQSFRNA